MNNDVSIQIDLLVSSDDKTSEVRVAGTKPPHIKMFLFHRDDGLYFNSFPAIKYRYL